MTTAAAVARHLIRLAAADPEGEKMTALRLHKLLYYCQGWHLAWFGRPLFAEKLEAWKHGPVVPDIYDRPWGKGRDPIPEPEVDDAITPDELAAVEQVWGFHKQFSACGLRERTHNEAPWVNHYSPDTSGRCSKVIPHDELQAFFGDEYRKQTGDEPGDSTGSVTPLAAAMRELGW